MQPDPGSGAALFGQLAEARVCCHSAAQQHIGDAVLAAGENRLGRDDVPTASWNAAAMSATGTASPAASNCSTQRATAVFSPLKDQW